MMWPVSDRVRTTGYLTVPGNTKPADQNGWEFPRARVIEVFVLEEKSDDRIGERCHREGGDQRLGLPGSAAWQACDSPSALISNQGPLFHTARLRKDGFIRSAGKTYTFSSDAAAGAVLLGDRHAVSGEKAARMMPRAPEDGIRQVYRAGLAVRGAGFCYLVGQVPRRAMLMAKEGRSVRDDKQKVSPKPQRMSAEQRRAHADHDRRWPIVRAYMLASDCLRAAQELVLWIRGTETWAHPEEVLEFKFVKNRSVSIGHTAKVAKLQWGQWDHGFDQVADTTARLMRCRQDLKEPLRLQCVQAADLYEPTDDVIGYWWQHDRFRTRPDSHLRAVAMLADELVWHIDDNGRLQELSRIDPLPTNLARRVREVLPGTKPSKGNSHSIHSIMEMWNDLPPAGPSASRRVDVLHR